MVVGRGARRASCRSARSWPPHRRFVALVTVPGAHLFVIRVAQGRPSPSFSARRTPTSPRPAPPTAPRRSPLGIFGLSFFLPVSWAVGSGVDDRPAGFQGLFAAGSGSRSWPPSPRSGCASPPRGERPSIASMKVFLSRTFLVPNTRVLFGVAYGVDLHLPPVYLVVRDPSPRGVVFSTPVGHRDADARAENARPAAAGSGISLVALVLMGAGNLLIPRFPARWASSWWGAPRGRTGLLFPALSALGARPGRGGVVRDGDGDVHAAFDMGWSPARPPFASWPNGSGTGADVRHGPPRWWGRERASSSWTRVQGKAARPEPALNELRDVGLVFPSVGWGRTLDHDMAGPNAERTRRDDVVAPRHADRDDRQSRLKREKKTGLSSAAAASRPCWRVPST